MSSKAAVAGTTRSSLASGAMACDHSTSRLISRSTPAHCDWVGMLIMFKFDEVSLGKPNFFEKTLASARIVGEPHQSRMTIVCPLPV